MKSFVCATLLGICATCGAYQQKETRPAKASVTVPTEAVIIQRRRPVRTFIQRRPRLLRGLFRARASCSGGFQTRTSCSGN